MKTKAVKALIVEASGRGFLNHYSHALAYGLHICGVDVQLMTGMRDELSDWEVPYTKASCLSDGGSGWRCIKKQVKKDKPDIIHLQWIDNPLRAIRFISWAQHRGIKVIYTPHNILPHEKRWLLMPFYRMVYRKMNCVIARDKHLAWALEEMLDTPRESIQYISGSPNMLALQALLKADMKTANQKSENETRLLFFGHGSKRKGLDRLLRIFANFENSCSESIHLVVAGEGVINDIPQQLIEGAQRKIRLTIYNQYCKPEKVAQLFSTSDLLLMPYIKLCKSPLLDLAASFKLPVLRSDRVQGAKFWEGEHGLTYHHENDDDLLKYVMQRDWIKTAKKNLDAMDSPVESVRYLAYAHKDLYLNLLDDVSRFSITKTYSDAPELNYR